MTKGKVLVGGVFDILHFGHISFLKKARSLGSYLVVILESDKRVKKLKGVERPIHSQNQRKEILEALKSVDEVILLKDDMTDKDYEDIVVKIKPNIIAVAKGSKTKTHAEKVGAKVVEIAKVKSQSTTSILLGGHQP